MTHTTLAAILLAVIAPHAVGGPSGEGSPIRPSREYPGFWEYKGKPIILLGGSVDDNLFQINDLKEHLDLLRSVGGNYVRNTMSSRDPGNVWPFAKRPDGKYDLNQLDDDYWQRFESLLRLARERDIIVQIELWDRFDFAREPWQANPYNPRNTATYTADQSGLKAEYPRHPGQNDNPFFRSIPALDNNRVVLKYQQVQVDRMLSMSLKYPNVLYCMDNETNGKPEWGAYWASYIRDRAKTAGVEMHATEMWDPWDLAAPLHKHTTGHPELYSFVEVSQNNHQKGQTHWDNLQKHRERLGGKPRPMNSVKVYGADTGKYGTDRDGIERFWRNLIGGTAAVRFHRPDSGLGLSGTARTHIRAARMLADAVPLYRCEPSNKLLSDRSPNEAYATAEPGKACVVYFPDGGTVGLDVSALKGKLMVRWLDIAAGKWVEAMLPVREGRLMLTTPARGHCVAVVTAAAE